MGMSLSCFRLIPAGCDKGVGVGYGGWDKIATAKVRRATSLGSLDFAIKIRSPRFKPTTQAIA